MSAQSILIKPRADLMRRGFIILALGLVGAVVAYCCLYLAGTSSKRELMRNQQPELMWLKQEFNLSDAEFKRVLELHSGYLPQCREMCRRIDEQNGKLQKLLANASAMTQEIESAVAESARLRGECQRNMLRHFFDVSRTMPPEQGKRYLDWMTEKTFPADHGMGQMADDPHP